MRKFDKLVKEIQQDIRMEMRWRIADDVNTLTYEKDFGNTTIVVDIEMVGRGCVIQVNDVYIERDNDHNSPLVVAAIKRAIPDWIEVEREVEDENLMYELEAQYMMN